MRDIDWNVELRNIEREFDGLPREPSATEVNARRAAERRAQQRKEARTAAVGVWARLFLIWALGTALNFWPYARACGAGLFVYLAANIVMATGSLWIVASTWQWRMARAHGLALLMVLWTIVLVGAEVLPRVGYANVDATQPPHWWCAP
jgi:hypothetical protein